jgi:glycerol-3-phosphate acyltransferase PlsY
MSSTEQDLTSSCALVLGVVPLNGTVLRLVWIEAVALWRYSSGGALTAFGLFPIIAALIHPTTAFMLFSFAMSGLIAVKHKPGFRN